MSPTFGRAVSEARARRASSSASASLRTSSFQPESREARRTFCPFLPMASESWSSGTITSMACSSSSMMIFDTLAGASARHTYSAGSLVQGTMSIFSPRSSCTTA